jgi:predicted DNA-binding protein with PD1-like motif
MPRKHNNVKEFWSKLEDAVVGSGIQKPTAEGWGRRLFMKASEGHIGRVFIIRLEDGDVVPKCIERFARENGVSVGHVVLVGGIGGGQVVVGPRRSDERPPDPMLLPIDSAHEVVGAGVLAPGQDGKPVLHIHAALGRSGQTMTGCLRPGVTTWLVGEVILYEIVDAKATRVKDKVTGFALLEPGAGPKSQ